MASFGNCDTECFAQAPAHCENSLHPSPVRGMPDGPLSKRKIDIGGRHPNAMFAGVAGARRSHPQLQRHVADEAFSNYWYGATARSSSMRIAYCRFLKTSACLTTP